MTEIPIRRGTHLYTLPDTWGRIVKLEDRSGRLVVTSEHGPPLILGVPDPDGEEARRC
jgi:ribosome biogenesis protein Nip4